MSKFGFFSTATSLAIFFLATSCRCHSDSNREDIDVRILNGIAADEFQFPYQVSLQKNRKHQCGGSIISDVKVLTAGHCVTDTNGVKLQTNLLTVLAGTIKLNVTKPKYLYSLKYISIHPKFDRRTVQYDYSIVFIDGIFDFQVSAARIAPIGLATQNPIAGTVCYLSGWGDVQEENKLTIPNDLQFARITVDPAEVCEKLFGNNFSPEQMLCAGRTNNENAGCGDSGGPLFCDNELSGIVSFGNVHYDSTFPDVYSSVAYVFEWINTSTADDGTSNRSSKDKFETFYYLITVLLFVL